MNELTASIHCAPSLPVQSNSSHFAVIEIAIGAARTNVH